MARQPRVTGDGARRAALVREVPAAQRRQLTHEVEGKMSKQTALEEIERFEKGTLQAFKQLHRATVAKELRARLDNPFLINQANTGTCGTAAVAFEIMRARPYTYCSAVAQLFQVGSTRIDKWKIAPNDALLKAPCPKSFAEADWVMLASIRDSENWFFDFHDDEATYADSGNLPEVEGWLKKAGFTDVVREQALTNIFDKTAMFNNALKKYADGCHVVLSINASCIDSLIPSGVIVGNHAVVLAGECKVPASKDDPIKIPIYTWGQKITIPRVGGLKYGQFLEQFFGYVAAKN
jgi:hypothetical protein